MYKLKVTRSKSGVSKDDEYMLQWAGRILGLEEMIDEDEGLNEVPRQEGYDGFDITLLCFSPVASANAAVTSLICVLCCSILHADWL